MKKIITLILMSPFFMSLVAQGITTKTKMIYAGIGYELYSEEIFSSDNLPLTKLFTLKVSNDKYTYIHDIIKLCVVEPNDMMSFLDYTIQFLENNEDGTSKTYKEMSLSTLKGKLYITVEKGYFRFKMKDLIKMQLACNEFIEKQTKTN